MRTNWMRASRTKRCPICGKPDWCLLSRDGAAAICPRVHEGAERRIGDAGWLHRLTGARTPPPRLSLRKPRPRDLAPLAAQFREAITPERVESLAGNLGVTAKSLTRLGLGYTGAAYSFPMCDAAGRIVGIRLRTGMGNKWSIPGSRHGVFAPTGLTGAGWLLVCEGPTDTAAMLDLGFDAIGRPSCHGGEEEVLRFARQRRVAIIADVDEAGLSGAHDLAQILVRRRIEDVRVIMPGRGKDAREWKRAGADGTEVYFMIKKAIPAEVRCGRVPAPMGPDWGG